MNVQKLRRPAADAVVHDVAEVLGISKSSAYVLAKEKGFPTLKIGARVVVPREKFIEWINKNISK